MFWQKSRPHEKYIEDVAQDLFGAKARAAHSPDHQQREWRIEKMIVCASVNVLFASETNGKRPPWYSRIHGRPPRADKAVPSHDGHKKC